jgi:hypothetical protein
MLYCNVFTVLATSEHQNVTCYATAAGRVVPLRAATKFFRHQSLLWVRSCCFLRRLASKFCMYYVLLRHDKVH